VLGRKKITTEDDPGRSKPVGPFVNPPPEEIVGRIGSFHQLLLNKYCIYRPMLLLPTLEYAPQNDNLDRSDFAASWAVMKAFKTPQMVIYNCGVNSGSSQGHKHLQLFPLPKLEHFKLFPSSAKSTEGRFIPDR